MSEMVERVTRAICGAKTPGTYCVYSMCRCDIDRLARAAIAAMREPTEGMVGAGLSVVSSVTVTDEVGDTWRAMIDAALEPVNDEETL